MLKPEGLFSIVEWFLFAFATKMTFIPAETSEVLETSEVCNCQLECNLELVQNHQKRHARSLSWTHTLLGTAMYMVFLAAVPASLVFAQSPLVVPIPATGGDCDRLPTKVEFVKNDYDKDSIKKIQLCLSAKGFYTAPVNGRIGPLTIAALEKYQAQKTVIDKANSLGCGACHR
jgi:hypothetical protein